MTIEKVSFREFIRGHIPADILMLWDKKSHKNRGLYISPEYAEDVLTLIKEREKVQKEKKKSALLDFVGKLGTLEELREAPHQEIKAEKYE